MGMPFFGSVETEVYGSGIKLVATIFTCLPTGSSGRMYYLHITDGIYMNQTFSTFSDATLMLEWSIIGLEPTLDYTCVLTCSNEGGSDTKVVRSVQGSGPPYEMSPSFYPTVLHQWIINNGSWVAQAGTCVACALATVKEFQEYREGKGRQKYSIGWIYGNRTSSQQQSEGMNFMEALTQLQADGTPPWNMIPENATRTWPDNYTYNDNYGLIGAKNMVANNRASLVDFARPQRIASFVKITTWTITQIREIIMDKGYIAVSLDLYDNFYDAQSNGGWIPTPHSGAFHDGHMMVAIGWKYHNGVFYWICQNSWGSWTGDNGLMYLPAIANFIGGWYNITDGAYPITTQLATPTLVSGYPTVTPSTIVFKINAVIGADSYRVECDAPDGSFVDASYTSTSITLSNKSPGVTYTIKVKAVAAGALDSDYLTFYATTQSITMSPPVLYTYYSSSINGDHMQVWWNKVSGATTYWVYSRPTGGSWTSTTNWYISGNYVVATFTGLTPGASYEFGIRSVYDTNTFSEMSSFTATPWYSKPTAFSWDTTKVAGSAYNVTAAEWNRLISTTVQLYKYKGWSLTAYPMTAVSSGSTFYATYFNQVKNAIGSKRATGIADKAAGNKIYAADLNTLVTTLNSLINAA